MRTYPRFLATFVLSFGALAAQARGSQPPPPDAEQPSISDLAKAGQKQLDAYDRNHGEGELDSARETALEILKWKRSTCLAWGKGSKKECALDNDITQSALRYLIRLDRTTNFANPDLGAQIRQSLEAVKASQLRNGGFTQQVGLPADIRRQADAEPADRRASLTPGYPKPFEKYRKGKEAMGYRFNYTFNDNAMVNTGNLFWLAGEVYGNAEYTVVALRIARFMLLAQLPGEQGGWAQQYNYAMQPEWARAHEPPSVASRESAAIAHYLIEAARRSGDKTFCRALPRAIAWLERSLSEDQPKLWIGPRFFELVSNRRMYLASRDDEGNGRFVPTPAEVAPEILAKDVNRFTMNLDRLKQAAAATCGF